MVEIEFLHDALFPTLLFYTGIDLHALLLANLVKVPVAFQGWGHLGHAQFVQGNLTVINDYTFFFFFLFPGGFCFGDEDPIWVALDRSGIPTAMNGKHRMKTAIATGLDP